MRLMQRNGSSSLVGPALVAVAFFVLGAFRIGLLTTVVVELLTIAAMLGTLVLLRAADHRKHPLGPGRVADLAAAEVTAAGRSGARGRFLVDPGGLSWTRLDSPDHPLLWPARSTTSWATRSVLGGIGCVLTLQTGGTPTELTLSATRPERSADHELGPGSPRRG